MERVLHLIDSFRQGGSESQALNLYLGMKKSGRFDPKLACLDRSGPLLLKLRPEERERIPEFKLNCFYGIQMARQLRRFAGLLRRAGIAVVHTHDFYTNVFGMIGATMAGVPVRVASRREGPKRPRIKRVLERIAYRGSNTIIANCDRIRGELIAEGIAAEKIITVHNGVSIAPTSSEYTRLAHRPANRVMVTMVANLRPVKDHATLLKAAKRVVERRRDASFVLAGEGELEPRLREMAAAFGIADHVRFIGRCDDVPGLLNQSDVCVLSSASEGFSNAILEYMAAGKPVVATRVGGVEEAISDGNNGFLVNPGDDIHLADRIVCMLEDPGRAHEMGLRGRDIVVKRFSLGNQLERVEQLYQDLLAASTIRAGIGGRRSLSRAGSSSDVSNPADDLRVTRGTQG